MSEKLESIKLKYEQLRQQIISNRKRMDELLKENSVKEFYDLYRQKNKMDNEFEQIYFDYILQQMSECEHIYVISDIIEDSEFRNLSKPPVQYYCVKCGLKTYTYHEYNNNADYFFGSFQKRIFNIYEQTLKNSFLIKTDKICPIEVAKQIYEDIIKERPNISNEEVSKLFNLKLQELQINHDKQKVKQ